MKSRLKHYFFALILLVVIYLSGVFITLDWGCISIFSDELEGGMFRGLIIIYFAFTEIVYQMSDAFKTTKL